MSEQDKNVNNTSKSRIIYTEPNFLNGVTTNGVDLTVPLEDLCISVNLIAEVKTRFMSGVSNEKGTEVLVASYDTKGENKSFFDGVKLDKNSDDRYLTSYFTDITYEDSKGGNVIEGLGISSIDINFESWFTPLVNIKFIDVRGSSMLVPNEYENQNDDTSTFSGEKLYKCFFTFPYPKFKLEIKGFYGRPVTYHLTCSKFNGNFNAMNGNFEANATFIGYNYSLLTDIQFQYLVAAPYDSYFGKDYFDKHKGTEDWLLSGGVEMPKLRELIDKIEASTGIIEEKMASDPNVIQNRSIANEKEAIDEIQFAFKGMMNQLIIDNNSNIIANNSEQIIFGFNSSGEPDKILPINYTDDFIDKQNKFISLVKDYNDNDLYSSRKISNNILPNNLSEKLKKGDKFTPIKAFTITKKDEKIDNITVVGNNDGELNDKVLKTKEYNDGRVISESLINDITILIKNRSNLIKEYIFIFNLNNFENEISNKIIDCDNRDSVIRRDIDIFVKEAVIETLSFVPTIGNITKILVAHLETFLASMFHCIETINTQVKNGERTLTNYRIKLSDTDYNYVDSKNSLPPFPLYLDRGVKTKYCGDKDENKDVVGWIGDVRGDCEEVALIYGYTKAMQTITEINNSNRRELDNNGKIQEYIPLCPFDLNFEKGPFTYSNINTEILDDFIGHIGLRAVLIFGYLFNSNEPIDNGKMVKFAEQAGEIDAYNYYLRGMSKDEINDRILNKLGKSGERSVNDIIEILQCSSDKFSQYFQGSNSSIYTFELIKGGTHYNRERNSMLLESDNNALTYTYLFANKIDGDENEDLMMVPTTPNNFKSYITQYVKDGNPFRIPQLASNINDKCITINDYDVKNYYKGDVDMKKYINTSVCNIFSDRKDVDRIINYYETINSGEINVRDYKKSTILSFIDKFLWKVSDKYLDPYYIITSIDPDYIHFKKNVDGDANNNRNKFLLGKLTTDGQLNILPSTIDRAIKVKSTDSWGFRDWYDRESHEEDNIIVLNTINGLPNGIDNYTIPEILIAEKRVINSLFGHPFYYMQNGKLENESENDRIYRTVRGKALLFLHSIPIECYKLNLGENLKNGGVYRIPKIVTLFIGSLLWRARWSISKGLSDILIYKDGLINYKSPDNGYRSILSNPLRYGIIDVDNWGVSVTTYFGYDIFNLRESIQNMFIQEFEKWVVDEFRPIQNNFELFNKDGSLLSTQNLIDYSSEWNGTFYQNGKRAAAFLNPEWIKKFLEHFGNNFLANYSSFFSGEGHKSFRLLNRENSIGQELLKKLYTDTVILSISTYAVSGEKNKYKNSISFDENLAKTYFGSIIKTLELIVNDRSESDKNINAPSDLRLNRDINIAMYTYLKNIYDKWLIGYDTNRFTVGEFFNKHFIIIDSFYCDIKDKLIVNCDYFKERYYDMNDKNLFSFLADIYSHHGMLFFPMSSFVDFSKDDVLNDMFKPLPYNSKPPMDDDVKFVCMYVYEPSKHLHLGSGNTSYGYKNDGFDIWTPEGGTSVQPRIFLQNNNNSEENTKYAYNIPSFGVAFGKANQAYFKNISVNMDNPITTEYSIKAIWDIAKLGSDTTKVQFIGQDLYSVWSNYCYKCEVEMMGCAQIQPLMYFQLLNIPMFRGTYIIISVSHSVTAGNMTTKFIGMRLSKNSQPFNTQPFGMLSVLSKNGNGYFGELNGDIPIMGGYLNNSVESYYKFNDPETIIVPSDDCGCENGSGWDGLSEIMKKLFYALRNSVESISDNKDGKKWTICISSGKRPKKSEGDTSDHIMGNAMDIQIKKNGVIISGGQDKSELGIVFDIIVTTYYPYIKQLIMEYRDERSMKENFNLFNTIHFASLGKGMTKIPSIYQSDTKEGKDVRTMYVKNNKFSTQKDTILVKDNTKQAELTKKAQDSLDFISPYYKNSSKKKLYNYLPDNIAKFKNVFTSFKDVPDDVLEYYFELNGNALFGISFLSKNKQAKGFTKESRCDDTIAFSNELNKISNIYGFNPNWLMIVMASESGIDPSKVNPTSYATGLIQIMPSYYNEWGVTSLELQKMSATKQLKYVDKYFSEVKKVFPKTKYIHPVDMYLVTLAPAILSVSGRTSNSVIYSSKPEHPTIIPGVSIDASNRFYKGNKLAFDTNPVKGYITIKDVQDRFISTAEQFDITDEDRKLLDYILSSSTYA